MYYDLPAIGDPITWFQWINQLTGGNLGIGILISFFVILFIAMKKSNGGRNETAGIFVACSFLTMIMSFFLFLIELVYIQAVMMSVVALIASAFMAWKSSGSF